MLHWIKKKKKRRKERIDENKQEIIIKGQKDIELLSKSSMKNIPKSVSLVLKKLDDAIEEL